MNTEAQKIRFERIDNSFAELKKNRKNTNSIKVIEKSLSEVFENTFTISIIESKRTDPCFVMSIFPEISTIDKIVESIVNEEPTNVVADLWSKNKSWTIEIDRRILDDSIAPISSRECTALLLHEVGHVLYSNSIPSRIARVMKYEFANMNSGIRAVLKDSKFKKILSLPILDSCTLSQNMEKENLKKEMIADNYAKSLGYGEELSSVLSKFTRDSGDDGDQAMRRVTKFSENIIENFKARNAKLSQRNIDKVLQYTPSNIIRNALKNVRSTYTEGCVETSVNDDKKMEYTCESVNSIIDQYYAEFFLSKKKLKRLDEYDLDYIAVEIDKAKTNDDKLLILSYIRSKIDIVQYYIDIVLSDKYSKKYEVPHSYEYLVAFKGKLEDLHRRALSKKIEEKKYGLTIMYPAGYEG